MIPHTYPSVLTETNTRQMVIYPLTDITGLQEWVDYIPVKAPSDESLTTLAGTFANEGFLYSTTLTSIDGLVAFKDYIPVYIKTAGTIPWSTNFAGYIPLANLFSILNLFANGEQGAWYDPSDFTTMFQDAAGTIPVTAVGQAVGRILDKSGRGNHATQTTDTKRPVLSALVNMLTKTEDFSATSWVKDGGASITSNQITAPDGTFTADLLKENSSNNLFGVAQISTASGTFTRSIFVKADSGNRFVTIRVYKSDQNYITLVINPADGTSVLKIGTSSTFSNVSANVVSADNGFYQAFLTYTITSPISFGYYLSNSANPTLEGSGVKIYQGDGTSGVYIWGADFRTTDINVGIPSYQRVNTVTDYDTTGFPPYLLFDGIDDALQTASINFTGTDKVTVWAGVRKLSDAASSVLVELSVDPTNILNVFTLLAPSLNGANSYRFFSRGSGSLQGAGTGIFAAAPNTSVITGIGGISSGIVELRRNGSVVENFMGGQGIGNYGNYPLYIGSRAGTSQAFNGRLYSLIIRGAQSTATQISTAETYVNSKTGAY